MAIRRPTSPAGVTLLEIMAAIVIVSVAVLGASGYRYYSTLDVKRASMQSTAARIALLLCENWRGRSIDLTTTYDPASYLGSELQLQVSAVGPDYPAGFTALGKYVVAVDGVQYWAALSWRDDAAVPRLRVLNIVVAWAQRQTVPDAGSAVVMDKTFKLTTYVSE